MTELSQLVQPLKGQQLLNSALPGHYLIIRTRSRRQESLRKQLSLCYPVRMREPLTFPLYCSSHANLIESKAPGLLTSPCFVSKSKPENQGKSTKLKYILHP